MSDLQVLLVLAIVIGFVSLGYRFHHWLHDVVASGPSASYTVEPNAADRSPCRADDCTVAAVRAVTTDLQWTTAARYLPPPATTLAAPAGQVFRSTGSFEFAWMTPAARDPAGYTLVYTSAAEAPSRDPVAIAAIKTPTLGYVRSARLAQRDQHVALSGVVSGTQAPVYAGRDGQARLRQVNPAFVALEFQPFDRTMVFEVDLASNVVPSVGDSAAVHLDGKPDATASPESFGKAVQGVVTGVTRTESALRVVVDLGDEETVFQLLRERVTGEQLDGKIAFPGAMWLEIAPEAVGNPEQLLRLPAEAVVRQGGESFVWVDFQGYALPVRVQELQRDGQTSVVGERPGVLGLPIRADHWRQLSPYCRGQLFQRTLQANAAPLVLESAVIRRPDERLRPGSRIRSGGT